MRQQCSTLHIRTLQSGLTWGGKHKIQYTGDALQNCTPETDIILLANVTPNQFK